MKHFLLLCYGLFTLSVLCAQPIIPVPSKILRGQGRFEFSQKSKIVFSRPELKNEAKTLQKLLSDCTDYELSCQTDSSCKGKNIYLQIDPAIASPEGYRLKIEPTKICISGQTAVGIFYGIQTLSQLFPADEKRNSLQVLEIEDAPRYAYRALMLDPARHFIPAKEIKRFINLMARYKFNVLQLHLTDDTGWRIEIKKYPLLTRKGAFREEHSGSQGPHNGFYTQEEVRELVAYAAERHIELIPELDIPGHTVAAIYAYPELGCAGKKDDPIRFGKTFDRTLCASQEQVYRFCSDILQEVCALFPSKHIHFGGDEAALDKNWGKCPECRKLMENQGMKNTSELMGYFFRRIHKLARQNGKETMLWCELDQVRMPAHDFLFPYDKGCILFSWRMGLTPKVIELTRKAGIRLVVSPGEHCYFDYPQYKGDLPEFNNWGMPLLSLEQTYNWDPGYGLPAEEQDHIIGVAGLLWGEAMQDINRITYMAYPRAMALAEAGWSRMENRNWENFKKNLLPHLTRLTAEGISFRVPFEIYR